ncbi:MAG TPA: hypothetical protein VKP66_19120 [Steroidobacteraceae bacterium]|nr:hypothetical protein [Steroidobacteraceae bacterium]
MVFTNHAMHAVNAMLAAALRLQPTRVFVLECLLEYTTLEIELGARQFSRLLAMSVVMSVSLAACGSDGGTVPDTASVSGAIIRNGVTPDLATSSGGKSRGVTAGAATGGGARSGTTPSGSTATGGSSTSGTTSGTTSGGTTGSGGSTGSGATGAGSTTGGITGGSLAQAPPTVEKSIAGWVSCDGTKDDTEGVARAFAAARHSAFTLLVDCPVRLHFGVDIARAIFIDSGTNVTFSGAGKFTVDNVLVPAFVLANSNDIVLTNWNVEYDASLPVNPLTGGYVNAGQFVASAASTPPAGAFNDLTLTRWLAANRAIVFDSQLGHVSSEWSGPANTSAVFYITGDTYDVTVTGMRLYVPLAAGADRFVPTVFSLSENYRSNQTITTATPQTSRYLAIPHNLTFSDIDLDGTYMGWLGGGQNAVFEQIRSHRYGDLQDASGGNVGGVGKWFSPPHLFYLKLRSDANPGLFNTNIRIHDVVDAGVRVGIARDKGGTDTISGYALSLKLGCVDCSVDSYTSNRPDGLMDVLASNGLTISNVTAQYNSAFLNNLYPGLRFPQTPYKDITFDNVTLTDTAPSSIRMPVSNVGQTSNENIVFKNVRTVILRWAGTGLPLPVIPGTSNSISLDVSILSPDSRILRSIAQGLEMTFQGTPAALKVGQTSMLNWAATGATSCSANGTWAGSMPSAGSRVVTAGSAGSYDYVFYCQNSDSSSNAVLPVVVSN